MDNAASLGEGADPSVQLRYSRSVGRYCTEALRRLLGARGPTHTCNLSPVAHQLGSFVLRMTSASLAVLQAAH